MKATVDSVQLSRAVSHVTRVLDPDHTALSVRAADSRLVFEAVGEGYSRASVQADVEEPGEALVAGVRFALYADAMPSGEVALSSRQAATGGFLNLSAGSLSVDARLLTGASMPQVPQAPADMLGVDPEVFGQAVVTAASFASRDKSNPVLGGVRLRERDGRLGIEATDRYRAYVRTLDVAVPEGLDVIAPAEWLRTAGAKATAFGATDRAMFVSGDGTLDMTPLIDGAYPDLGRAFSPERLRSDSVAKVERAALVKAARTMRRLVDDKPVMETRFGSDGVTMTLRGADQDVVQWVPAEVSADATRRINIDYLLDALAALGSDDVEVRPGRMFRFVDESDPSTLVVAAEFRGNQD